MAMKKSKGNIAGAVGHGALGIVPFGNMYEGYKGAKTATGSRAVGVGGALAANLTYPVGGVVGGAYHGYHTANPRNAKTGVRSKNSTPARTKGRVHKKGY